MSELTAHSARAVTPRCDESVVLPRVGTSFALLHCCLVVISPHSRRWGPLMTHLPAILAHVSVLVSHLLLPCDAAWQNSAKTTSGTPMSDGGGYAGESCATEERPSGRLGLIGARWEVCVSAARLMALALRRNEALVLDTRGVQCALQVAVSLVSALVASGFAVPGAVHAPARNVDDSSTQLLRAGVEPRKNRTQERVGGSEGREGDSWAVGEEINWQERQLLAAAAVTRGCVVMEVVSDVLYSLIARRSQVFPLYPFLPICCA